MSRERMGRLFEAGKVYHLRYKSKHDNKVRSSLWVHRVLATKSGAIILQGEVIESGESFELVLGKGESRS